MKEERLGRKASTDLQRSRTSSLKMATSKVLDMQAIANADLSDLEMGDDSPPMSPHAALARVHASDSGSGSDDEIMPR